MVPRWDLHCDVLSKMIMEPDIRFEDDPRLDVTASRMRKGNIQLQAFAIYIPQQWKGRPIDAVLASIDAFHRHIASRKDILPIRSSEDIERLLRPDETRIGALLTLEGADGLEGSFTYLRIVRELGVRTIGITWNNANWAADGAGEPRGGGFTKAGKQFIAECNAIGMPLDVSHLSVKAFWELMENSAVPPIASHSNAYTLCPHPRNITDEQIRAIIANDGRIGINFYPPFLRGDGAQASMDDVLRHVEHICSLGGVNHVGFGSDFDGIDIKVPGLEKPEGYDRLEEELSKHYSPDEVEGFLYRNWWSYYRARM